jgi:hypothetical protein
LSHEVVSQITADFADFMDMEKRNSCPSLCGRKAGGERRQRSRFRVPLRATKVKKLWWPCQQTNQTMGDPSDGETINVISQLIVKARSSIPRGLDHAAQGWPDSQRAYPGYRPFKYHLLAIIRMRHSGIDMPAMSSNKFERYCEVLVTTLQDERQCTRLFGDAVQTLDKALGGHPCGGVRCSPRVVPRGGRRPPSLHHSISPQANHQPLVTHHWYHHSTPPFRPNLTGP